VALSHDVKYVQKLITTHAVVHLAWKKGACCGRAAFDITFQHKTTFSLKTSNQPINFAILPNFGNPSCYFISD